MRIQIKFTFWIKIKFRRVASNWHSALNNGQNRWKPSSLDQATIKKASPAEARLTLKANLLEVKIDLRDKEVIKKMTTRWSKMMFKKFQNQRESWKLVSKRMRVWNQKFLRVDEEAEIEKLLRCPFRKRIWLKPMTKQFRKKMKNS